MSAPVEPFVVITSGQVVAAAVTLCVGASGLVAAIVKWSFSRNIKGLDDSIAGLRSDLKATIDKQHAMELLVVSKPECAACRKECHDRMTEYQRIALENDRIQNQKLDNLLMMVANVHNGLGGVKNGIHTEPKVYEKP